MSAVTYSVLNKLLWSEYVYDSKRRRRFYQSTGTLKRAEQNLIVRIGKYETDVTNNKRPLETVLLKLTTDSHSRSACLRQQSFLTSIITKTVNRNVARQLDWRLVGGLA